MERFSDAGRRLGKDLGVVVIAFWLVFSAAFLVGRASMPSTSLLSTAVGGSESPLLGELRTDLAALGRSAAAIEVTGAIAGRWVLDNPNVPYEFVPLGAEADPYRPGTPIDLDVRYESDGVTLAMVIRQLGPGIVRTEAMTILVAVEGRSFNAHAGDCTVEPTRSGYLPEQTPSGFALYWPYFAGHATCTAIADIRSGETISFTAVFEYE